METVTMDMYNPHSLVTLKKIINTESGDVQFELYKITELEAILDEMHRRDNLISQRIEHQEKKLGQIIDNLSAEGWYNSNTDKEDILRDLCEILDHEPKQEITLTATINVTVRYDCPLEEVEDFDAHYFLQDNLSVEAYNGDIIIDSYDIEDADVDWS